MDLIVIVGLLLLVYYSFVHLIKTVFNIIAFYRERDTTDPTKIHESIVFNKETGRIEGDRSTILPFN